MLEDSSGELLSPKPCVFTIPENYPVGDSGYIQMAKIFYSSENYTYFIESNNLYSGCSLSGIKDQNKPPLSLLKGVKIVLPIYS